MSVYSGDFLGFSLGGIHSSQLNITRVSSGDRYTDSLIPTFQDQTIQVPGGDGTYYWDTFYTQKTFQIDFAFDDLRDEDLRALRQMFGFKGIQPLIFDEFPYKKYMVKVTAPPQIKFIPFDQWEFRIYKGEGSVQLVSYYPYALGVVSPSFINTSEGIINNNGDLPANLEVVFDINNNNRKALGLYTVNSTGYQDPIKQIVIQGSITNKGGDSFISVNSRTHLIEGLDNNFNPTGHLYNEYIISGDFFNPETGRTRLYCYNSYASDKYPVNFVRATYTPIFY